MDRSPILCRCCGGVVTHSDAHPIHTACISRHWGRHHLGLNASKCREFGAKLKAARAATEGR